MRSFRFLATILAMSLTVVAQKPSASQHTGEKLSKSQSRTLAATAKTPRRTPASGPVFRRGVSPVRS